MFRNSYTRCLRQEILDDVTKYIGQAVVAAGVVEGEAFVVDAHEVEDGDLSA